MKRISLNVVVFNEEARLEECLLDARDHVDEIVVVDQMSTDGTPEIAQRLADVAELFEVGDVDGFDAFGEAIPKAFADDLKLDRLDVFARGLLRAAIRTFDIDESQVLNQLVGRRVVERHAGGARRLEYGGNRGVAQGAGEWSASGV